MNYTIQNDYLKITISIKGAELQSIQALASGREFLWQGDPQIWGKRSPLLFPVVGRLVEDKLKIGNEEYVMKKHGFAQDRDFKVDSIGKNEITFVLKSSEETKINYPYEFALFLNYKLEDNRLIMSYRVENRDDKKIYFSIGAHPGFCCKMGDILEFECNETLETYMMNKDGYLYDKIMYLNNQKEIVILKETFQNDALMFQGMKSGYIVLKSSDHDYRVKVQFDQAPYLGLWAKPGAPYVCIEPWFGINDFVNEVYLFPEKPGVVELDVGKTFDYKMEIKAEG